VISLRHTPLRILSFRLNLFRLLGPQLKILGFSYK